MNKTLELVTVAVGVALLAGCAAPRYIISTTDGTMIEAKGQPKLNKNTGMYDYKNLEGRSASIKQASVKQILKQ